MGTPAIGFFGDEKAEPSRTEYVLFEISDYTKLTNGRGTCSWSSFCSNP